jgi:hypothetical protein
MSTIRSSRAGAPGQRTHAARTVRDDWTGNTNSVGSNMTGHLATGRSATHARGRQPRPPRDRRDVPHYAASSIDVFAPFCGNTALGALQNSSDVPAKRNLYGIYLRISRRDRSLKLVFGSRYDWYTESQVNNGVASRTRSSRIQPRAGVVFNSPTLMYGTIPIVQTPDSFATRADGTCSIRSRQPLRGPSKPISSAASSRRPRRSEPGGRNIGVADHNRAFRSPSASSAAAAWDGRRGRSSRDGGSSAPTRTTSR